MNILKFAACISLLVSTSIFQAKDIFFDIAHKDRKAVRAWLKTKPNLSIYNDRGQSILHVAALTNNYGIVKTVQGSKIDVNLLDLDSKTALDLAIEHGSNKIAYFLMKKRSTVTRQDNLDQAKILLKNRYKKIMRIFWIIAPIVILTIPIWLTPFMLFTLPQPLFAILFAQSMAVTFLSMWSIPVYASTWKEKRFLSDLNKAI